MQSNYGIVTKLGIQLMQPPPYAQTFLITFEQAEDLPQIIDTMFPLRINMAPLQNIAVLRNILLDAAQVSRRADWYAGEGPIPGHVIEEMKRKLNLGLLELRRDLLRPAAGRGAVPGRSSATRSGRSRARGSTRWTTGR